MKKILAYLTKIFSKKDLIPKIICLILAIILWAYVNSTKVGDVKFRIPVELNNLPENLTIFGGIKKFITVTLTGRKDILKNVNIKNINASVDLTKPSIGLNKKYPVKIVKQGIPESIELSFSNKDLALTIDKKASKRVKVEPNIQMNIKDGYIVGNIRIDPPYVKAYGPESVIDSISSFSTRLITTIEQTSTIKKKIPLDTREYPYLNLKPGTIGIEIPIHETALLNKHDIRIEIRKLPDGYEYELSKQDASIYIKPQIEGVETSEDEISIYIDVSSLNFDNIFKVNNKNSIERDFYLKTELLTDDMEVFTIIPKKITIIIRKFSK